MDSLTTENTKPVRDQKYTQANSRHFETYEAASSFRGTLEGDRIRVRRRKEGFDVVTYKEIKPEKVEKEEKPEKVAKTSDENKKPFKKGKKPNRKKEKKVFNPLVIPKG